MKISVDGVELFELSETQKKVIKNDIKSEIFEDDIKRSLEWVISHKYEQCFKKMKAEWDEKLEKAGVASIPTNKDAYAELVFKQKAYKNRTARDEQV